MKSTQKQITIEYTEESAFHTLSLPDADELKLKADLMRCIADIVAARGLTQSAAGAEIGMDQPRMSALLGGKITKFSVERLVRALNALGQDVEVRVKPARKARGETQVKAA